MKGEGRRAGRSRRGGGGEPGIGCGCRQGEGGGGLVGWRYCSGSVVPQKRDKKKTSSVEARAGLTKPTLARVERAKGRRK